MARPSSRTPPTEPPQDRKRTFDLCLFNMATDAQQRAGRLAGIYDMTNAVDRPAILQAMRAEIALAQYLTGRILEAADKAD